MGLVRIENQIAVDFVGTEREVMAFAYVGNFPQFVAQKYTAAVDFSDLDRARLVLDRTHAFADPNEADAAGIRLVLPTPEVVADVP